MTLADLDKLRLDQHLVISINSYSSGWSVHLSKMVDTSEKLAVAFDGSLEIAMDKALERLNEND